MALIEFGSDENKKYTEEIETDRQICEHDVICKWPQPVTVIAGHWKQHQSSNFCFFIYLWNHPPNRQKHTFPIHTDETHALILHLMKWRDGRGLPPYSNSPLLIAKSSLTQPWCFLSSFLFVCLLYLWWLMWWRRAASFTTEWWSQSCTQHDHLTACQ